MIAIDLISQSVFPLKKNDSVEDALLLMNDWRVFSLPVVESGHVIGFCSVTELVKLPKKTKIIHHLTQDQTQLTNVRTHAFDLIKQFAEFKLSTITLVDEEQFKGIITWADLIEHLGKSCLAQQGAVIELQMSSRSYTLAEISRLVESNDVKILHLYVRSLNDDEGHVAISMKLNSSNIRNVLQTFERYQYQVTGLYHAADTDEGMNSRFKNLIKYLDI